MKHIAESYAKVYTLRDEMKTVEKVFKESLLLKNDMLQIFKNKIK